MNHDQQIHSLLQRVERLLRSWVEKIVSDAEAQKWQEPFPGRQVR